MFEGIKSGSKNSVLLKAGERLQKHQDILVSYWIGDVKILIFIL